MKLRRTITLEEGDIALLKPLIEKYNGNISRAIREVIRSYRFEPEKPISPDNLLESRDILRSKIINENIGYLIPLPLAFWLSGIIRGVIPPMGLYRVIIEKFFPEVLGVEEVTLDILLEYLNPLVMLWGSHGNLKIKSRRSSEGVEIVYEDTGFPGPEIPAIDLSYLLAHEPFLLKVVDVKRTPTFWRVRYTRAESEDSAWRALVRAFGENQDIMNGLAENSRFWQNIASFVRENGYDVVILTRSEFSSVCRGDALSYDTREGEEALKEMDRFGRMRRIVKGYRRYADGSVVFTLPFDDVRISKMVGEWLCTVGESCGKKCRISRVLPSRVCIKIED